MAKFKLTTKTRVLVASALLATVLSACGQTTDWIRGRVDSSADDPDILGAPEVEVYLAELGRIASGDPAAQAEIYADAAAAAQLTPSASTNLRLGLVLSIPGIPGIKSGTCAEHTARRARADNVVNAGRDFAGGYSPQQCRNADRRKLRDQSAAGVNVTSSAIAGTSHQP